ncbi:hypothetical protein SALBM311S_08077 [Streptomyces alboniger]
MRLWSWMRRSWMGGSACRTALVTSSLSCRLGDEGGVGQAPGLQLGRNRCGRWRRRRDRGRCQTATWCDLSARVGDKPFVGGLLRRRAPCRTAGQGRQRDGRGPARPRRDRQSSHGPATRSGRQGVEGQQTALGQLPSQSPRRAVPAPVPAESRERQQLDGTQGSPRPGSGCPARAHNDGKRGPCAADYRQVAPTSDAISPSASPGGGSPRLPPPWPGGRPSRRGGWRARRGAGRCRPGSCAPSASPSPMVAGTARVAQPAWPAAGATLAPGQGDHVEPVTAHASSTGQ